MDLMFYSHDKFSFFHNFSFFLPKTRFNNNFLVVSPFYSLSRPPFSASKQSDSITDGRNSNPERTTHRAEQNKNKVSMRIWIIADSLIKGAVAVLFNVYISESVIIFLFLFSHFLFFGLISFVVWYLYTVFGIEFRALGPKRSTAEAKCNAMTKRI